MSGNFFVDTRGNIKKVFLHEATFLKPVAFVAQHTVSHVIFLKMTPISFFVIKPMKTTKSGFGYAYGFEICIRYFGNTFIKIKFDSKKNFIWLLSNHQFHI